LLLLTLAITAYAGWLIATKLEVNNTTEYFARGNDEILNVLDEFRDDFGRDDMFFVVVEGDIFTPAFIEKLDGLHKALETFDCELPESGLESGSPNAPMEAADKAVDDFGDFGDDEGWGDDAGWGDDEDEPDSAGSVVDEVISLINVRETVKTVDGILVRGLMETLPSAEDLPALRKRVLNDPTMVGAIIGKNGTHTALAVRTALMSEKSSNVLALALTDFVAEFDEPGFHVQLTGLPILNESLNSLSQEDMKRLVVLAMLVMGLVLVVLFRSPVGVIPPLMVVSLAMMWVLAGMAYFDTPMTLMTNILPAFLACVGLGDSIHLLSVYRDERVKGVAGQESIKRALASVGVPMTYTTLTTAAGLASFGFASTEAIQEMGIAGAVGVCLALLHTLVFLPIVLSLVGRDLKRTAESRANDRIDAFLWFTTNLSLTRARRARVLLGTVVLSLLSALGMYQLDVYHNPLIWFGDDSPVTVGMLTMDHEVGGTSSAHVLIESTREYGVRDLELLQGMEKLEDHIESYVHPKTNQHIVTNVLSMVDVVKESHRALHSGEPEDYRLPDDQRGAIDAVLMFENSGPDELSRLATTDLSKTHMTIRVMWMDASSYEPFREYLEEGIDRFIPKDGVSVKTTGSVYTILSVVGNLITDLLKSFGVALVAITVMMLVLLWDLRLGLISIVPNLIPIAVVMGFMGFVGIDIDMVNLLIASIIIGIAVDDTIHYLHQFKVGYSATGDVEKSIEHAVNHAGRALLSTSVVLTLGFSVYMASVLVSIQRFGLLVALACVVALLADLLIAPALLRLVYGRGRTPSEES
jgi:uncharacterized protein